MNLIKLSALLVTASLATGCTSWFKEQREVADVKNREAGLIVPDNLQNPLKNEQYKIYKSVEQTHNGILSPNSVLVILDRSWVNREDPHPAKIMIEKPQSIDDLARFLDNSVRSYADTNGYEIKKTANGYRIKQVFEQEVGFWLWSSDLDVEAFEYDVNINVKENGRSGDISIDPVAYKVLNKLLAPDVSSRQRSGSLAIETLNNIMIEASYLYRVKVKNENANSDISLKLVKNIAGHYVISSQQDIKIVWSQVDDLIEDMGFDIQDQDKTLYVYDTEFSKSSGSVFNLFGTNVAEKLIIPEGEYEVALSTSTTGVHISFRSKDGDYLNQAQMENLFQYFIQLAEEDESEL